MRRCVLAVVIVAALAVCTPTEPCACPPGLTFGTVYGSVLTAAGAPAVGARVDVEVDPRGCPADPVEPLHDTNVGGVSTVGADGRYRHTVRSYAGPTSSACLRVVARLGLDSAVVRGALLDLSASTTNVDSVRVDLRLPAGGS